MWARPGYGRMALPGITCLSSRWTLTISRLAWASPHAELKVQKRTEAQRASWDLDSELAQYHFTCILLTKWVTRSSQFLGLDKQILPSDERTYSVTLLKTLHKWCHLWNLLHCSINAWSYKFSGQNFFQMEREKSTMVHLKTPKIVSIINFKITFRWWIFF